VNERPIPPNGWQPTKLNQIVGSIESGVSVNSVAEPARATEFGVLKVSAVTSGRFDSSQNKRVTAEEERKRLKYSVRPNSIMMTRSNGSTDLVGACVFVEEDHPNLFLSDKLWDLVIADEERDDSRWLYYLLCSSPIRQRIVSSSSGSVGMRNVSKTELLGIKVGRPPFPEQQKIAAILSTWDRAIELTEKLIAAKQRRKQALMQQLLTGKVRFAEFEGKPWRWRDLGELTKAVKRPVQWDDDKLYKLASIRRHSRGMFFREPTFGHQIKVKKLFTVEHNDFLISNIQAAYGAMGLVPQEFHGSLISDQYTILVPRDADQLDIRFLGFVSETAWFRHQILLACNGFFAERLRLLFSTTELLKRKLFVPPTSEEQHRIVEVLKAANDEIGVEEQRLNLLRDQKKGLMQQLLTGKIRVNTGTETVKG